MLSDDTKAIQAKAAKNEESDEDDEDKLESNISKTMSDSITKVVIVTILVMLFMLPLLHTETYVSEQLIYANAITLMTRAYNEQKSWLIYQKTVE